MLVYCSKPANLKPTGLSKRVCVLSNVCQDVAYSVGFPILSFLLLFFFCCSAFRFYLLPLPLSCCFFSFRLFFFTLYYCKDMFLADLAFFFLPATSSGFRRRICSSNAESSSERNVPAAWYPKAPWWCALCLSWGNGSRYYAWCLLL